MYTCQACGHKGRTLCKSIWTVPEIRYEAFGLPPLCLSIIADSLSNRGCGKSVTHILDALKVFKWQGTLKRKVFLTSRSGTDASPYVLSAGTTPTLKEKLKNETSHYDGLSDANIEEYHARQTETAKHLPVWTRRIYVETVNREDISRAILLDSQREIAALEMYADVPRTINDVVY